QEDVEGDHLRPKLELAGLDLREVEHVVDELEQVLARLANVAEEALLPIAERGGDLFGEQPRKTKDRVEGRSELVAHIREELGLHSSRLTEFVIRGSEICIEAGAAEDDRGLGGEQLHQSQTARGEERGVSGDPA